MPSQQIKGWGAVRADIKKGPKKPEQNPDPNQGSPWETEGPKKQK